ncbi:MAG: hypothetical protein GEU82_05410 [Luteitalea sp.]|nr:hypothetical protein [Luteitalea sp.]
MRKLSIGVAAALLVGALGAPAFAATETLKGQIIDEDCYAKDKANNQGNDHKMPADTANCAVGCAKSGAPMALLTADGKIYTIKGDLAANKNAKLVAHVTHTVEITGDVTSANGKMSIAAADLKMVSR